MSRHQYGMNQRSISAILDDQIDPTEPTKPILKVPKVPAEEINRRSRQANAERPRPHHREATRVRFSDEAETSSLPDVVRDYRHIQRQSTDLAVAVAAIKALTNVIINSKATTMMGLGKELEEAANQLIRCEETAISLQAACELFLRYTTRIGGLEHEDFREAKQQIVERGNNFAATSIQARKTISELGARFIRHGSVVLTHAFSRVVLEIFRQAALQGIQFTVVVTEGRPDENGLRVARALEELNIPVTVILDGGAAYAMDALKVDMVMVGAEAVVENGGIINKLGTYGVALAAAAHNKPVYVAAESYKFARLYPLGQRDFPVVNKSVSFESRLPQNASLENPNRDFSPPGNITLLFTDLGVLTPAAVSDELIQLYV